MNKTTNYQKAKSRAVSLWDYYLSHDKKITCGDVFRLTGQKSPGLYVAFLGHEIEGPPLWDSKQEIRKRQIAALRKKAISLGRDWLTTQEAAAALEKPRKEMYHIKNRFGDQIPEIRSRAKRKISNMDAVLTERIDVGEAGSLKAWSVKPGPGSDEVTYLLK